MLVLASTSPYRRQLLARLQLQFETAAPEVDEAALPGEAASDAALRLAQAKARAVSRTYPNALIIGSDQVAELDGVHLGKPGSHQRAVEQLRQLSGRRATFHSAIALLNSATGRMHTRLVPTYVRFRELSPAIIEAYLRRELPYDCAGSAKSEGLGIALLHAIEGDDPTALIGLPLIALTDLLQLEGLEIFR